MALDPTIALQAQPPSFDTALKPISSLLGIQNAVQEQKSRNIQNEQNQAVLQERNNLRQLFQDPKGILDESGNIDFNKAAPAVMTAAPTQGGQILQGLIAAQSSAVAARRGVNALNDEQRASVGQYIMSLAGKPPEAVKQGLDGLVEMQPGLKAAADHAWKYMLAPSAGDPDAFKTATLKVGQSVMTPPQQAQAITPNVVQTDNGQQIVTTNLNPLAAGGVGSHPIAPIQKQLPPNTPVYNPKTQSKEYLGSQDDSNQAGFDPSHFTPEQLAYMKKADPTAYANGLESYIKRGQPAGGKPLQIDAPMGQADQVAGTVDQVNKHWLTVSNDANNAKMLEGIAQNIRAYSHGAATGQLSAQKALVQGVLAQFGVGSTGDMKTDTDLMLKNMAMYTGNSREATDAARVIRQAASPHQGMSEDAINEAALQLVGQARKSMAERDYLKQYKLNNDVNGYTNAQSQLAAHADPRIWQYQAMDPEHQKAYLAKLKPDDRARMIKDAQALENMGVLK